MTKKPMCFVSYAGVDFNYVEKRIIPELREIDVDIWYFPEKMTTGKSISETLIKGIKKSDLIITIVNSKSIYTHFEIGAALGNNKPILAIVDNKHDIYTFKNQIRYLRYRETKEFRSDLRRTILGLLENVIDKNTFSENKRKKIVGIQVGLNRKNFEEELNFTTDFISFLNDLTNNPKIELLETSKGSLKSLVSIDLKSWAELVEKVIFFIPELKKRKADRLKVEAEVDKIIAETRSINANTEIRQAEAFIDLFEKYTRNGIKIQIDKDLLITQDENGQIKIIKPKSID